VSTISDQKLAFEDHYDVLQLSPNADADTVDRVYRILVKRYHPDNQETGDTRKFNQVVDAHRVLSDPEKRAAYNVQYDENRAAVLQIFDDATQPESYDGDRRIFEGVLSLLYVARRRDADRGGMGVMQMEHMLACPAKHLEFHLWYLREKGWVQRLDNGMMAISALGVDRVMEQEGLFLRRDRLISDRTMDGPQAKISNR
jgi:hypothetical protein